MKKTRNKLEHTPTPWLIGHVGEDLTQISIDGSDQRLVAIAYSLDFSEQPRLPKETQANAEFIVRAVNSHEALLDAVKAFISIRDMDPKISGATPIIYRKAFDLAERAVAQAEGK